MSSLPIEGLEAAIRPDRLYPVRTAEGYGFYAGLGVGSRQLLAAVDGLSLLVMVFDSSGDLRESYWWDLSPGEDVRRALWQWFGWEPALVRVKRFGIARGARLPCDPMQLALVGEDGFAIAPLPLDWLSSIDDPASLRAERDDFAAMVQGWGDRGNFVLYWGNEYQLDGNGEIVGS
jgi:hypothetical protein